MRKRRLWGYAALAPVVALLAGVAVLTSKAMAEDSSSSNYQMVESQFGNSSSNQSCSSNYCTSVSVGNDSQTSPVSTPALGTVQYSEPMIEVSVQADSSSMGDLTAEHTGTKTMTVKIRNYLSGGYMLQITGTPPSYQGHSLTALSTPAASTPGKEQFGINVVANTTPSMGANPVAQPSGGDASNTLMAGYNTANLYKYIDGDTVASTQTNTGGADYTISMIVNIANSTPAGHYSGDFAAMVLPYY